MAKMPNWLVGQESKMWFALVRLSAVFGIVTPVGTIVMTIVTGSISAPAVILALYVCALTTFLVVLLIRMENRSHRELRYGPATMPVRKAFTAVASASWNLFQGDPSQEAFRLRLQESLRYFAEAFTLITGAKCRASIKLIQAPLTPAHDELDIRVRTLCRDGTDTSRPPHEVDRIGDNTDFKQIFTEAKAYFICNDLPKQLSKGYHNSHWDARTFEEESFDYKATIVWPIERTEVAAFEGSSSREIIGFLCVDTLNTGAFHPTYDVALGGAFSQALHLALHQFRVIEEASRARSAGSAPASSQDERKA